jgi:hypothetical protein
LSVCFFVAREAIESYKEITNTLIHMINDNAYRKKEGRKEGRKERIMGVLVKLLGVDM